LAVYWITELVPRKMSVDTFAREYGLSTERVRSALGYAKAFPEEIESDKTHAEGNRQWIEAADAAAGTHAAANGQSKHRRK